jgi:hypothetical protein
VLWVQLCNKKQTEMGLDSVELLMRFEKEFKKDVPDQDAGNISTVGDMANWFFNNLPIHQPDKRLRDTIINYDELLWDLFSIDKNKTFKLYEIEKYVELFIVSSIYDK